MPNRKRLLFETLFWHIYYNNINIFCYKNLLKLSRFYFYKISKTFKKFFKYFLLFKVRVFFHKFGIAKRRFWSFLAFWHQKRDKKSKCSKNYVYCLRNYVIVCSCQISSNSGDFLKTSISLKFILRKDLAKIAVFRFFCRFLAVKIPTTKNIFNILIKLIKYYHIENL